MLLCAALLATAPNAYAQAQAEMIIPPTPVLELEPSVSGGELSAPAQTIEATPENKANAEATAEGASSAAEATAQATPLILRLSATVPALEVGPTSTGDRETTATITKELTIPAERAAIIRQRGIVTQSLGEDLARWTVEVARVEGARFEKVRGSGGGWKLVQHNGFQLDQEATRAALLEAVLDPSVVAAEAVVEQQITPERDLEFFNSRGITAHLGTGNTNYRGSSKARMTNIHVGAGKFKDRLFEGDVFSFNEFLGPITEANEFVTGLVISGGRTVEGLGGGICQVSTTVFRSLYRAGLPVVERSAHSYQVGYYQPQGLDAAIYQPTLDLKFKNDTGGAIWFQTDWDDKTGEFNIYAFGKPRDFEVRLSEPRTVKSIPPLPDRTIYTADLPTDERKQVDWAANGGTLEVDRLFVRGGEVFKKETLKSTYKPWPNIFLVGE